MKRKTKKAIVISVSVILLLFVGLWMWLEVIIPSDVSYARSCDETRFEEEYSESYYTTGQVTVKQSIVGGEPQQEVEEVQIFEEDEEVIKHEWIHIKQIEKNRVYSCDYRALRTMNEAEAYLNSKLPNPIFNAIYGKPKI